METEDRPKKDEVLAINIKKKQNFFSLRILLFN